MKNRWICRCRPRREPHLVFSQDNIYQAVCRYGNCAQWRCVKCRANLGGFGSVGCKCDGYIREFFHPDMASLGVSVPVKPSVLARRNRKPQHRERFTR